MLKLILVIVIIALGTADLDTDWTIFKMTHNKTYSPEEGFKRKNIWIENKKYIKEHNKLYSQGLSTYYLGENEFADMTHMEFVAKMNGLKVNVSDQPSKCLNTTKNLPQTVDWHEKGFITEVKNQEQCGSCWAFSATGSIEGQHFKITKKLISLSESNLVDCSGHFGNNGCGGGLMSNAFAYVTANHGIDTEASYPYMPQKRTCRFNPNSVGATISSSRNIVRGSVSALQEAVAEVGPISCAMDASHPSFKQYRGGIYNPAICSRTRLDHAVLTIGYGTHNSSEYWLVKNSWGTSWGNKGYFKLIRNANNKCGIATLAIYPVV